MRFLGPDGGGDLACRWPTGFVRNDDFAPDHTKSIRRAAPSNGIAVVWAEVQREDRFELVLDDLGGLLRLALLEGSPDTEDDADSEPGVWPSGLA